MQLSAARRAQRKRVSTAGMRASLSPRPQTQSEAPDDRVIVLPDGGVILPSILRDTSPTDVAAELPLRTHTPPAARAHGGGEGGITCMLVACSFCCGAMQQRPNTQLTHLHPFCTGTSSHS